MSNLFSNTMQLLHKNLDLRHDRHKVLTSNIANAETPRYIAKDVCFEEALREASEPPNPNAMRRTHAQHLSDRTDSVQDVRGTLVAVPSDDVGFDLNGVSIDQEMSKLSLNTMHYNASIAILTRIQSQLRYATEGGK